MNRFTSMFSNGLFYIVLQGYISYSFIINGMLVISFKIKTLLFCAEKPYSSLDAQVPYSMQYYALSFRLCSFNFCHSSSSLLLPCPWRLLQRIQVTLKIRRQRFRRFLGWLRANGRLHNRASLVTMSVVLQRRSSFNLLWSKRISIMLLSFYYRDTYILKIRSFVKCVLGYWIYSDFKDGWIF